jgi:IclR family acetate operon transcriptional repressor
MPRAAKATETPRAVAEKTTSSRRNAVQSVARAFDVLNVLKDATEPMSALQISRATGLDRTVVHRLLRSICEGGMALEDRGTFRLGPEPVLLAHRYLDNLLVRRLALPYMLDLQTNVVGEQPNTVSLSIPVRDVITVIERIWTPSAPLGVVLDVGDTVPIDKTAAGRALLAYLSADELERLLGSERAGAMAETLEQVRAADGIGLTHGEAHRGVDAVAAAIRSRRSRPVATIAVSGPDLGDELAYDSPLAGHLRRAADAIGQSLP